MGSSGYYAALTGLVARTQALDTASGNLANAQTVGFKREVAAAVSFDRHIAAAAQAQPGQQSQTAAMVAEVDQTPGTLRKTGESLDVAISGPGWFEVQTEHGPAYTRQGPWSSFVVAVPSHHDVRPSAPSHVKLVCTWSVCGFGPV